MMEDVFGQVATWPEVLFASVLVIAVAAVWWGLGK